MGFRTGSYATVWNVETKTDTWTKLKISVSRKNKDTGEYEDEFNGFVDCFGTAVASKAASLQPRDRIKLGDIDVKNSYDKEKGVGHTNFQMFSFDRANEDSQSQPQSAPKSQTANKKKAVDSGEVEPVEDNLPF